MFVEQNVLVRGWLKKPTSEPVSLSSMMIRHYDNKGQEMSNDLVEFVGIFRVSSTINQGVTEDVITIRLESNDLALVNSFIRTFLSRDETDVAFFEGQEISMI